MMTLHLSVIAAPEYLDGVAAAARVAGGGLEVSCWSADLHDGL